MLTPQDIQSKEFTKAVFGGYDMAAVDDFLEELTENYSTLYKDNAVLKGKLKVLVEKVEEYRSTEDAMRMALLTAHKMSDDMVEETKKKCDEMISSASQDAEKTRESLAAQFQQENRKLEEAKAQTAAFVKASKHVLEQYVEFLSKLEGVVQEYAPEGGEEHADGEPQRSPEPEPGGVRAGKQAEVPKPQAQPQESKTAQTPAGEVEMGETIKEIDDFVAGVMEDSKGKNVDMSAETRRMDPEELARAMSQKKKDWNEEDELTTPRPKFDFSDLKFGTNYKEEEEE